MPTATERAREAMGSAVKTHEVARRIHSMFDAYLTWSDKQSGEDLIEVPDPDSEGTYYCHTSSKSPLQPNDKGERTRWLFTDQGNSLGGRVIIAHFQYWGPHVSERKPPSYTEMYWINETEISPNPPDCVLSPDNPDEMNMINEILTEMARLTGKDKPKSTGTSTARGNE